MVALLICSVYRLYRCCSCFYTLNIPSARFCFPGLQMQHELRGRPSLPPSLWRLQRLSERHHAERQEPAELRAICPQVEIQNIMSLKKIKKVV